MSKMIFINLPVRDPAGSLPFYEALGGTVNPQFSDDTTKSVMLSDAIVVMLISHARYATFTDLPIGDARMATQGAFALNADSKDDVDAAVARLAAAGGRADPSPVQDLGFMYSRGAADPDGYVWDMVWMDMSAANCPAG